MKRKKIDSKEIGLEIGIILAKNLFHSNHLHFGYWTDGPVDIFHMPAAQENYATFLISHLPAGVKTILDVGCGVGSLVARLIDLGYEVDCVSPSPILTGHARNLLGNRSHIFECRYEDLATEKRYDMILFSESFQYINPEKGLQSSLRFLNGKGYLLICDFFKTEAKGKSFHGGGHRLASFYEHMSRLPFSLVKDIDITRETAPTIDMTSDLYGNVGRPIWETVIKYLNSNYRFLAGLLQWKYKKKIAKINRKYFSGENNGRNFSIFKSYRLFLYQKIEA